MRVIGTAGHVDHGKSTLVQALTGTHPDRLKEEREREMTIDLGFAWLTLPGDEEVGIVDVPGHRDFIENMLAGVGNIDAVLFVIAADEGVMPQTREHLAILDLLQVQGGVVALTKIDLVEDGEWLDLVEDDVRRVLHGTVLEDAPLVRVSARSAQGIPDLIQALSACLADRPPRPDLGRPRLPVDRVFTIAGFGTVVTGTLTDGCFRTGEELQILGPRAQNLRGRVRGLQTHKQKEEIAVPGSRTAINISGVDVHQLQRGDVVAHPGDYRTTRRLDVRFRLLPDLSQPLKHNTEVKLFIWTSEVVGRVRLLGADELLPGGEAWLQLELREPVVAVRGDRYILRRPSPGETLGGGMVVEPQPRGRHRRFARETLERLAALTRGTPEEVFFQALSGTGAAPLQEVVSRSNLEDAAAFQTVRELLQAGQLVVLEGEIPDLSSQRAGNPLVTSAGYWERLAARVVSETDAYHHQHPLRRGLPREELKSRLKLTVRLFNAALKKMVSDGLLVESGPLVYRPGHAIRFNAQQQQWVDRLMSRFAASPFSPPTIKECQVEVGEELYDALVDLDLLIPVSAEVVFRRQDFESMLGKVRELFRTHTTITAAQVRDHFNTSRRYVLAFLEYLDARGITVREGDVRRLKK